MPLASDSGPDLVRAFVLPSDREGCSPSAGSSPARPVRAWQGLGATARPLPAARRTWGATPLVRPLVALALALVGSWPVPTASATGHEAGPEDGQARPVVAVARPNLRLGVDYAFAHVDATRTRFDGPSGTQTLRLDAESGHAVSGRLVGTLPVFSIVGLRATVHGGFDEARRSLDALSPGESTIDAYGGLAEILVRDPRLGAFAAGAGYDRLEGDGGVTADQVTGRAEAQFFFPDLGSGPVDWLARFEFRHRQIAGAGQGFDVDADVYQVTGGARWYVGPDVAVVVVGDWQRSEEEFFAEDDVTGRLALHWRLPLALGPASIELFAGGFAGSSEYKEPPFRGDQRLLYGGRAGLTLRLFSGATLLDSIRRFD